MVTFIASLLLLVLGYVLYGAFVDKVFGAESQRAQVLSSVLFRVSCLVLPPTYGLCWDASLAVLCMTICRV